MGQDNKPRSFDLTDESERARLLRETVGYALVSLSMRDGTDFSGREWAYIALRNAVAAGYTLVPPAPENLSDLSGSPTVPGGAFGTVLEP
jgi:hypothetical protein